MPATTAGAGSTVLSGIRSTSDTASTRKPTTLWFSSITIMRELSSSSLSGMRNRLRSPITGKTLPRRLITPSMNSGALGTCVIWTSLMISFTTRILTPNSSSPSRNVTSWIRFSSFS